VAFQDVFGDLVFRPDASLEKATIESADRSLLIEAQPSPLGIALNIEGGLAAGRHDGFVCLAAGKGCPAIRQTPRSEHRHHIPGRHSARQLAARLEQWLGHGRRCKPEPDRYAQVGGCFVPSLKLEGDLRDAQATFQRPGLGGLWRNAEAVLNAEITRGTLYGVDLGEAARRHGVSEVRAGATKFDRLLRR
jgi:hypothetical protein